MGGVAIRADGGVGQQLLADFLSVHRAQIGFQLFGVAGAAANARDAQAPLVVLRCAFGWYIETVGVMAAVARCVGFGLVVRIRARMERLLVGLNVVGDDAQAWALFALSDLLGLLPQFQVAACASIFLAFSCPCTDSL